MQKQRLLPKLTMRRIALQRSKRRRQCDPRPFIASWQSCAQLSSLPLGISLSPFIHEEGLFLDTGPCGRQHLRVRGQDLRIRHAPVRRSHHTCVIRLAQISSAQPGSSAQHRLWLAGHRHLLLRQCLRKHLLLRALLPQHLSRLRQLTPNALGRGRAHASRSRRSNLSQSGLRNRKRQGIS